MGNEIYSTTRMNTRATPANPVAGGLDRERAVSLFKYYGGSFHGPIVEHASIEEEAFYRFCDALVATALEALGGGVEADEATVERVAACIYGHHCLRTEYNAQAGRVLSWGELPSDSFRRGQCLDTARAIAALKEPTNAD